MRRLAVLALLGLAACGQKGDLYLPDQGTEVPPESTPAATPAPDAAPAPPATPATPADPDDPNNPRRN